jgi:hypothetical protein
MEFLSNLTLSIKKVFIVLDRPAGELIRLPLWNN